MTAGELRDRGLVTLSGRLSKPSKRFSICSSPGGSNPNVHVVCSETVVLSASMLMLKLDKNNHD